MSEIQANGVRLPITAVAIYSIFVLIILNVDFSDEPVQVTYHDTVEPEWSFQGGKSFLDLGTTLSFLPTNSDQSGKLLAAALDSDSRSNSLLSVIDTKGEGEFASWSIEGVDHDGGPARCLPIADVTKDGVPELAVCSTRGVKIIDGRSGARIHDVQGSKKDDWFGYSVLMLSDIDGDGIGDLAIGAPGNEKNTVAGRVVIASGKSGKVIREIRAGRRHGDRFGMTLAKISDIDLDGTEEIIVGAPGAGFNGYRSGAIYLVSIATGKVELRHEGQCDNAQLGIGLTGVADVDFDEHLDYATVSFSSEHDGCIRVFDGRTGRQLSSSVLSERKNGIGSCMIDAGDMNGDGNPEVAVSAPFSRREDVLDFGEVFILSATDGSILHVFKGRIEGGRFGSSLVSAGDTNGDGRDEIYIGAPMKKTGLGRIERFELPKTKGATK